MKQTKPKFGAIKPPWVDEETFLKLRFNYCDRWCERCQYADGCRVYQKNEQRREEYIKEGKDPDSMKASMEMVADSFAEAIELIEKDAERLGIDLEEAKNMDLPEDPDPEEMPLYKTAYGLCQQFRGYLENIEFLPIEANEKFVKKRWEVISYYVHFIPAKVYRALLSKIEEDRNEDIQYLDSKVSAFILVNALLAVSEALRDLAVYEPLELMKGRSVKLSKLALEFAEMIEGEFM